MRIVLCNLERLLPWIALLAFGAGVLLEEKERKVSRLGLVLFFFFVFATVLDVLVADWKGAPLSLPGAFVTLYLPFRKGEKSIYHYLLERIGWKAYALILPFGITSLATCFYSFTFVLMNVLEIVCACVNLTAVSMLLGELFFDIVAKRETKKAVLKLKGRGYWESIS